MAFCTRCGSNIPDGENSYFDLYPLSGNARKYEPFTTSFGKPVDLFEWFVCLMLST